MGDLHVQIEMEKYLLVGVHSVVLWALVNFQEIDLNQYQNNLLNKKNYEKEMELK